MTTVAKTEKKKTGPDPAREVDGRQCATHEEGRRGGCGRSNSSNSSGGEALRDHGPISKKGRGLAGWNAGGHEGEREVFLSLSLSCRGRCIACMYVRRGRGTATAGPRTRAHRRSRWGTRHKETQIRPYVGLSGV